MARANGRWLAGIVGVVVAVASAGIEAALAGPCPFPVSPETARRVFDHVKALTLEPGYRFEGLGTEGTDLTLEWSNGEQPCPKLTARVDRCWSPLDSPSLEITLPGDLGACGGLRIIAEQVRQIGLPQPQAHYGFLVTVILAVIAVCRLPWLAFALLAIPLAIQSTTALTLSLSAAWIVFAISSLRAVVDRPGNSRGVGAIVAMAAVFLISLLLGAWFTSGGPGDLHLNLAGIWFPESEWRWGPAPTALYRMMAHAFGGIGDHQIEAWNLIASSLAPVFTYAAFVHLGLDPRASWIAAVTMAAHPVLILFSGVLERQPLTLMATAGSLLGLSAYLRHGARHTLVAFGLGTALAATSRPEGVQVAVLHTALLLLLPAPAARRRLAAAALAVLLLMISVYLRFVLMSPPLPPRASFPPTAFLWSILGDPNFTPLGWTAAAAIGLVLGVRQPAAWIAAVSLVGFDLLWRWTGLYSMFVGQTLQLASARYQTILAVPLALGIALFAQFVLRSSQTWRWFGGIAFVVMTALTLPRSYQAILPPLTIDHEYQFLRDRAQSLPPTSLVYVFDAPIDDIGLIDAHLVGQFAGANVSFRRWGERRCGELEKAKPDVYLYLGSSCAPLKDAPGRSVTYPGFLEWMRRCAEMRRRVEAGEVAKAVVPGRKMSWNDFVAPTVTLGLYRIVDTSLCQVPVAGAPPVDVIR